MSKVHVRRERSFGITVVVLLGLGVVCAWTVSATVRVFSSVVEILTVYSENNGFYVRSVPFDNSYPTMRGRTTVFDTATSQPVYVMERNFDVLSPRRGTSLVLSNDGETIFYTVPYFADEEQDGLKSVNVYRHGRLLRSYTVSEVTGCDRSKERCSLLYANYDAVVDKVKSKIGPSEYRKVFKDGVDPRERFLNEFALFSAGDAVYLTDPKKRVHVFDLAEGRFVQVLDFDAVFEQLRAKARPTRTEVQTFEAPHHRGLPKLADGRSAGEGLAEHLGMTLVDPFKTEDRQYKSYRVRVTANILVDGRLEIEDLTADPDLSEPRVRSFFDLSTFDRSGLAAGLEKWNVEDAIDLRKSSSRVARRERKLEEARERQEFQKRLAAETIDGVYIPKDLGECLIELDRIVADVDKNEIRAMTDRDEMTGRYHFGLGLWMRNNWGLWGGSRLQTYFTEKGVAHPDEMSGVILEQYYEWLKGNRNSWRLWEQEAQGKQAPR